MSGWKEMMRRSKEKTTLAMKLRVLRAQRGFTLGKAAEDIGINIHTLSDLECGLRYPRIPTLAKIAQGYGVPVEELLVVSKEKTEGR